ncbi:unnamed protein product [Peniophora sp. CBMAI 1063]|nr:unnamed protein product [Peniophora sp. CBMAI 1063]
MSEETLVDVHDDALTDTLLAFEKETLLNGRYEVVEELGFGRHSSVWLARDTSVGKCPLRAVKVLTRRATRLEMDEQGLSYELELLRIIKDAIRRKPDDPGSSHVVQFLDDFTLSSPLGDHLALVTNVLGHHVGELQAEFENGRLPSSVVRHFGRQLLQALAFLHDECGIVHTDIKQDNIILDDFGATDTNVMEVSISLADFGEAVPAHGDHYGLIQPTTLRCPEVIAGLEWDAKADIWNLGCLIFELLAGTRLFVSQETRNANDELLVSRNQFHLAHIYSYLQLPQESDTTLNNYLSHGRWAAELFSHEEGLRAKVTSKMSLEEILHHYDIYTPELLRLLRGMLRILPHDRLSARELLLQDWFHVREHGLGGSGPNSVLDKDDNVGTFEGLHSDRVGESD